MFQYEGSVGFTRRTQRKRRPL